MLCCFTAAVEGGGGKKQQEETTRKKETPEEKKKVQILKSEFRLFFRALSPRSGPGSAVCRRRLAAFSHHHFASSFLCVSGDTTDTARGAILAAPQHVCCDVQSSSRELSPLKDKGTRERFDRQELEHRLVHV